MAFDTNCLEIIFSGDDHYARHMGAAVHSLLTNNTEFDKIRIHVIDNHIAPENIKRLEDTVGQFANASLIRIPFDPWRDKLKLDPVWPISLSSYARLFVAQMLPETIGRVLYLDSDMIICGSLRPLWETDLGDCVVGAVQDYVGDRTKIAVGLSPDEAYFNAGLLLIDMDKWREQQIEAACLSFIEAHNGSVAHHDQGVLNGVLHDRRMLLPVRYNLMTIHYLFNRRKLTRYFNDHADFYGETEMEKALDAPVILHFTPSFTSRPWVKTCRHPKKQAYWDSLGNTPWRGTRPEPDKTKWYIRLINWRYRCLPY